MTDELAAACQATIDELAWRAHEAGDDRPIGMLRVGVLAYLIQRPWLVPDPLGALTADRFLTEGSELPAVVARPGSVAEPTGVVAGGPITAAHVRDLLTQLDAIGLHTPPGGSLTFSFTDQNGALHAVATPGELRLAARRGCPAHPGRDCGCAVIARPAATGAYTPTAAHSGRADPRLPTASTDGACSKNDEGPRSWPWRIEVLRAATGPAPGQQAVTR